MYKQKKTCHKSIGIGNNFQNSIVVSILNIPAYHHQNGPVIILVYMK